MGNKISEKRRKLFDKRKESTERMAMFGRRHFNNLRKNWKIKYLDHLLPNAEKIFNFIDEELSEMDILKDPKSVVDWHQVVTDEEFGEGRIQENIAILSWVYWQRLEGYETLDVSLSRERLVEDIGCIQQFYNSADGLILEYQGCFSIKLPENIMCVYGLYPHFHTAFRHFIMVPNQTRYDYIPAWISVAHEVAHIAVDEIEKTYKLYLLWQAIRKRKKEIGEIENIKDNIPESRRFLDQLRKKEVPQNVKEIIGDFDNLTKQICLKIEEKCIRKVLMEYKKKITSLYSTLESAPEIDHPAFCTSVYEVLNTLSDNISNLRSFIESFVMSDQVEEMWKKLIKIQFELLSVMEITLEEKIPLELFKNQKNRSIEEFFSEWKKIKRRATNIAETTLRLLEGDTGLLYLQELDPKNVRHVYISEHILADIIAALIAGEFYLYSLAFYRFLPSAYPSEEGIIHKKQRLPMSLRLFICLETLKYSCWEEMEEAINDIEELWIKLASNNKNLAEKEKEFQKLKEKKWDENCKKTADLIWNLIKSITVEDSYLEEGYADLLKGAEEGSEEEKEKFDRSYFNYMRHALGNALKEMLRNHNGFLVGMDSEREKDSERNCLKGLVKSVKKNFIDRAELFTTPERYETIKEIKEDLKNGILRFDRENCNKEESDHAHRITPRNILSAYAQIYFEYILNPKKKETEDYITTFNPTVMSMAWSQHALERFHDGKT